MKRNRIARQARWAASLAALALGLITGRAQNSIAWTTNYYSVTGASFREIQQAINAARPGKNEFAGETRWTVEWKFNLTQSGDQCSCSSFSTATKIVTTLPRWVSSATAPQEVKDRWSRFYIALAQHEAGHARIATSAAAAIGSSIARIAAQADCDRLTKLINAAAERVMEDYRRREKEYDRVTDHGRQTPDVR